MSDTELLIYVIAGMVLVLFVLVAFLSFVVYETIHNK